MEEQGKGGGGDMGGGREEGTRHTSPCVLEEVGRRGPGISLLVCWRR